MLQYTYQTNIKDLKMNLLGIEFKQIIRAINEWNNDKVKIMRNDGHGTFTHVSKTVSSDTLRLFIGREFEMSKRSKIVSRKEAKEFLLKLRKENKDMSFRIDPFVFGVFKGEFRTRRANKLIDDFNEYGGELPFLVDYEGHKVKCTNREARCFNLKEVAR